MSKAPLKVAAPDLAQKGAWGSAAGLLRPRPNQNRDRDQPMADDKVHPTATEMDYPAHFRNYSGFLSLLKWGVIVSAITTAVVLFTISN
jgi:hypothetical protein